MEFNEKQLMAIKLIKKVIKLMKLIKKDSGGLF